MKKYFFILACLVTYASQAQIEYTDTQKHVACTVYAGILAGPKVVAENGSTAAFYSLRAGGTIAWTPKRWITLFGLGGGETSQTDTTVPFALFGLKLRPTNNITLTTGKVASPMTEFRPLPTTAGGQFEPWTKSHILGSALGAKVCYAPTQKLAFTVGSFWRNTETSYEAKIQYGPVAFGGYYMGVSKTYGAAVEAVTGRVSTTAMFNQKQNVGMFNTFELSRAQSFFLYSDVGFDYECKKMLRGEWGFFKTTSFLYLKVLIGAGYAEKNAGISGEKPLIKGYVFIHI